jgi:restriction system protein
VTGRSGDGGIDFTGRFIEKHSGVEFLLFGQAKHWHSRVGSDPIRTFVGSVVLRARSRAAVGVCVSTGGFTDDAKEAARISPTKIVLMDLDQLVEAMLQNGIGISEVSIRSKRIDNGFWHDIQG